MLYWDEYKVKKSGMYAYDTEQVKMSHTWYCVDISFFQQQQKQKKLRFVILLFVVAHSAI
jgi:hypothetical protein